MLHTYSDGSIIKVISSRELITIPIWKGQRILDMEHAMQIKKSIGENISSLDSGFSIIKYNEENANGKIIESKYLIDGQHRAFIIKEYYESTICEPPFPVTVTEKHVESESEAISYFNKINNVKAQQWKIDPNLLINGYIIALETAFNSKKCILIRNGSTTRPYISSDNLRQALSNNIHLLKNSKFDIQAFIERVKKFNLSNLNRLAVELTVTNSKLLERTIHCQFSLAYDTKLRWVREILSIT